MANCNDPIKGRKPKEKYDAWDVCCICGAEYFRKGRYSIYCSMKCRVIDHYSQYAPVVEDWKKMYLAGTSLRAIAREYNTNHRNVSRVLAYAGVTLRRPARSARTTK